MISKKKILAYCVASVEQRIKEVELAIKDADAALADDTKSSAGDKYETSREMVQQDIDRYQKQLVIANNDLDLLKKIDVNLKADRIGLGSLVQTDIGVYFISISIGLVKMPNQNVFVISPQSPIGQVLVGNKLGDKIVFNNKGQEILELA